MSIQTPKLPENRDNIDYSKSPDNKISILEENFIKNNNISVKTLGKLKDFIVQIKSSDVINNSQEKLINLKDFVENSDISESEKLSLNKITDNSFQEFAYEVFAQIEISKQQLSQLDSYIHGSEHEQIAYSQKNPYISDARFTRACNPTKPHHHIDGCIAGITQSATAVGIIAFGITKGAITFIPDVTQVLLGKAEFSRTNV